MTTAEGTASTASPASEQAPVWGDLDQDAVTALLIEFRSPTEPAGTMSPVKWVKADIEPYHWARILEIAETPVSANAKEAHRTATLGFTWVSRAWLANGDPEGLALAAPDTIEAMAEAAGIPLHAL